MVKGFGRCASLESSAGASVEFGGDEVEVVGVVAGEVGELRKVLPEETVGVFVAAALPR